MEKDNPEPQRIAVIGTGSMGSMMAILFAEQNCFVSIFDPSKKSRDLAMQNAKEAGFVSKTKRNDRVKAYEDYASLCDSLAEPKVFLLSVPHGTVGDSIVEQLHPYLKIGDIIIDGSNEHWDNTQRRQAKAALRGVGYIGMGVSGGYQAAREGPSLSPGGDDATLNTVMPLLQKVAARDLYNKPCVTKIGPGGSGHYVKMIHNGIEQGMMSALCEIWGIMTYVLGMEYEEISSVWAKWNRNGPLKGNYLLEIGIDICRRKDPSSGQPLLNLIRDKVVQDVDETEGTGVWTCMEGARLHIPIPTITAAHQFRLASAYSANRRHAWDFNRSVSPPQNRPLADKEKESVLVDLRDALHASFLASFCQGLSVLAAMNAQQRWQLNFPSILCVWSGGCIIRSQGICEVLLSAYRKKGADTIPILDAGIGGALRHATPGLKRTVTGAVEANAHAPALGATLDWIKYSCTVDILPTAFMEAQLDYFGKHMFELRTEDDSLEPKTGSWHFGWKPAKGVSEKAELVQL